MDYATQRKLQQLVEEAFVMGEAAGRARERAYQRNIEPQMHDYLWTDDYIKMRVELIMASEPKHD